MVFSRYGKAIARSISTACFLFFTSAGAFADCIKLPVTAEQPLSISGDLTRPIFPGPPGYEDITNGDVPEPSFILTLNNPICTMGDDYIGDGNMVEKIHLYTDGDKDLESSMRKLVGSNVTVVGHDVFGAHTGHHHAPLLMQVDSIEETYIYADGPLGLTTVKGFYLALETGDGATASSYVIPAKRKKGPLSAKALTSFYGSLKQPLEMGQVIPIGENRYRARYTFETQNGKLCNGSAIVSIVTVGGKALISRIKSETGC